MKCLRLLMVAIVPAILFGACGQKPDAPSVVGKDKITIS